jgi:hypothetical protein
LDEANHKSAAGPSALLDVSIIMQLKSDLDVALTMQQQALAQRQLYRIPAKRQPSIRLLMLKIPGSLAANTPLEFLVEESNIDLTMLYVSPDLPFPETLPDHDVMFVAIGQSEQNLPILKLTEEYVARWPRPVLNLPNRIAPLERDITSELLQAIPGVVMPVTTRVQRLILERFARGEGSTSAVRIHVEFPVQIRPVSSNRAGGRLVKLVDVADLSQYLAKTPDSEFFVAPFVDYRSKDGKFRKYRIVLIDARPFASQMGISDEWTPNFVGPAINGCTRQDEQRFFNNFEEDFARRHAEAFECIARRVGLDYLVVDCAETRDGKLLVLEVDSSAAIHAIDAANHPFKKAQFDKTVTGFSEMLLKKFRPRVG